MSRQFQAWQRTGHCALCLGLIKMGSWDTLVASWKQSFGVELRSPVERMTLPAVWPSTFRAGLYMEISKVDVQYVQALHHWFPSTGNQPARPRTSATAKHGDSALVKMGWQRQMKRQQGCIVLGEKDLDNRTRTKCIRASALTLGTW